MEKFSPLFWPFRLFGGGEGDGGVNLWLRISQR